MSACHQTVSHAECDAVSWHWAADLLLLGVVVVAGLDLVYVTITSVTYMLYRASIA